ncbi:MAG: c-type cytochrome [Deltaproteobacteria bacterium]|nr:c-type cytochrome [Deltaproteobacteria bacterium]
MNFRVSLVIMSAAAWFFTFVSPGHAGIAEGKKIFDAGNCGKCHQTAGPAKEKTIEDQLAKKGPELWYAGNKFQKPFLQKWLIDPKPIRGMEFNSLTKKNGGNHPKLAKDGADNVTEYLMSLVSTDFKPAGIQPKNSPQGRMVFEKKQGCFGCHEVKKGEKMLGGLTGPTMVGIGDRLQPDWIYAYLLNPKVFKPVKDMPTYAGILSDDEIKMLAEYVSSLK